MTLRDALTKLIEMQNPSVPEILARRGFKHEAAQLQHVIDAAKSELSLECHFCSEPIMGGTRCSHCGAL